MSQRKPVFKPDVNLNEIRRVSDFKQALWWLYETGIQRGESTGWPLIDTLFTVRAREWTLLTGIPSHGKSAFLDNLMVNMAVEHQWRWAVFSAENLPLERHAAGLAQIYIGRPFGPGMRERISQGDFHFATLFLDQYFRFVCPPDEDRTIDRVLAIAHLVAESEGVQGVVIDPWNELDHVRPGNQNETEYVSGALSKIRKFAREHECHVFLVAHPTKLQRMKTIDSHQNEATIYPVPTPYDVSGSAHFRNKADNCLCVWRDVANPHTPTQIHVQKIRFREVGQLGMQELYYDIATGQYVEQGRAPRRFKAPTELESKARLQVIAESMRREHGDYDR